MAGPGRSREQHFCKNRNVTSGGRRLLDGQAALGHADDGRHMQILGQVRQLAAGRGSLGQQAGGGERGLAAGDFVAAVAGYESALHMYTPASSLVDRSAQRLWALGEGAEGSGDLARALIAYRSLRSSFYAVAGLTTPGREWIERCDARISTLVKMQQSR